MAKVESFSAHLPENSIVKSLETKLTFLQSSISNLAEKIQVTEQSIANHQVSMDVLSRTFVNSDNNVCKKLSTFTNNCTFERFASMFNKCIDDACKLRTPKYSKRNSLNNPWITKGVINSISKRDRLYKEWKRTRTKLCTSGDPRLYEEYRSQIQKYAVESNQEK